MRHWKPAILMLSLGAALLMPPLFANATSPASPVLSPTSGEDPQGDPTAWHVNWFRDQNHNKVDDQIEGYIPMGTAWLDFLVTFSRAEYTAYQDSLLNRLQNIVGPYGGVVEQGFQILPTALVTGSELNYPLWQESWPMYLDPLLFELFVINDDLPVVMIEAVHALGPAAVKPCHSNGNTPQYASGFLVDDNVISAVWDTAGGEWPCGTTGALHSVAILDAGMDVVGSTDGLKFAGGYDAVTRSETDPIDQTGKQGSNNLWHGTRVGYIAQGLDKVLGVAPFAVPIDVNLAYAHTDTLPEGHTTSDRILEALDWVLAKKDTTWTPAGAPNINIDQIDVVNISYTDQGPIVLRFLPVPLAPTSNSNGTDNLSRAVDSLVVNAGITVVVGAGNEGLAGAGFRGLAAASKAITVGAYDAADPDSSLTWSSHGGGPFGLIKPDLAAPGVNILTSNPRGTGTSFAAPQVAGAVALMRQAHPTATPAQLAQALRDSAEPPAGHQGYHAYFGYGRLDVDAAITELDGILAESKR